MPTIAKTKQPVRMPRFGHRVDKTDPIMRGCVGWWPLNDGAGAKAVDLSTSGNDLTVSGTVNWSSTTTGTAADFIGTATSDFANTLPSISIEAADDVSYSVWINPDSATEQGYLIGTIGSPITGSGVYWGNVGSVRNVALTNGTTVTGYLVNIADIDYMGSWVHVVVTKVGSSGLVTVYINGASAGTVTPSYAYTDGGDLRIGNRLSGTSDGTRFDGQIQNARIYKRVLTADEVSRLYTEPWAGLEPPSPFSFFSVPTAGAPLAVFYNHYKNQGII